MSADNGIYIGQFPTAEGYEWRVAHAQAIENCDDDPKYPELTDAYRVLVFGNAQTFTSEDEAVLFAHRMSKEYDILEYGVCSLTFDRPLSPMSKNEAERKIRNYWKSQRGEFL